MYFFDRNSGPGNTGSESVTHQPIKCLKKVLLVDDDTVTNLMHRRVMERSGLVEQIEVATDGLLAIDHLEAMRAQNGIQPELILLDINMPRMNGFEFLQAYAKLDPLPLAQQIIIMLSTSLLRADRSRAEADPNVHRFANKPVRLEDMLNFFEDYQKYAART